MRSWLNNASRSIGGEEAGAEGCANTTRGGVAMRQPVPAPPAAGPLTTTMTGVSESCSASATVTQQQGSGDGAGEQSYGLARHLACPAIAAIGSISSPVNSSANIRA